MIVKLVYTNDLPMPVSVRAATWRLRAARMV
jgi:hypothetical protein